MKKTWSLLLCLCLLTGCASAPVADDPVDDPDTSEPSQNNTTTGSEVSDEEFEAFLDQYVIDVCENDYSTAHHYFEDPEAYGIDVSKATITLGTMVATEEDKEFTESILKQLKSWDSSSLSETNQQIYQQLEWMYEIESESNAAKYDYIAPIWSEMRGVQSNLVDFFAEYQLYTEDDIEPLIELINDTPRYVQDALDYSQVQADKSLLRLDLDAVVSSCQSVLDSQEDSPITAELDEEVDNLMLDESTAESWKKKIHDAMDASFFPAFQSIIDGLTQLEPSIREIEGLASYRNGADYYTLLLKYYTGTNQSERDIYNNVYAAMRDASDEYKGIQKNYKGDDLETLASDPQTSFTKIADIMPFLEEHYATLFPSVGTLNYEIKPLSDEQSKSGVLAYFVVPPIDSKRTYEIRYNARDYADDPSSLSLYNTFAHEGIPGHMYQTQYEKEHFTNTAQYFLSSFGMQEGYAVYAGYQACKWTGIDPDVLRVWQLTELYSNYMVLIMDMQINYDGMSLEEFSDLWGEGTDPLYYQLAENPGIFFGYYYGYYMIDQLYQSASEQLKDKFDEAGFNNALLQAGNVEFSIVENNIQNWVNSVQ